MQSAKASGLAKLVEGKSATPPHFSVSERCCLLCYTIVINCLAAFFIAESAVRVRIRKTKLNVRILDGVEQIERKKGSNEPKVGSTSLFGKGHVVREALSAIDPELEVKA